MCVCVRLDKGWTERWTQGEVWDDAAKLPEAVTDDTDPRCELNTLSATFH